MEEEAAAQGESDLQVSEKLDQRPVPSFVPS